MEIKYTYEQKVKALLYNSVGINLVSLASTYFSLERLFAGDWLVVLVYIGGSILGKWMAMTHFEKFKQKIKTYYIKLKTT
jgi:positive regulator of sigma E activity